MPGPNCGTDRSVTHPGTTGLNSNQNLILQRRFSKVFLSEIVGGGLNQEPNGGPIHDLPVKRKRTDGR